jgi:NLI interacting factor-like phosphatase
MQATTLGGGLRASRLLLSVAVGAHIYRVSNPSLLLTVHARCSVLSTLSHPSLDRRRSLTTTSLAEPRSISNGATIAPRRPRGRKVVPTAMEVMEARLSLLTTLIAATEGKEKLNSKQKVRRDKHIWEKAQIEIKIDAYKNGQTFAETASAKTQPPVVPEPNNIPAAVSTHSVGLMSASAPAAQINAQKIVAINRSLHELPAGSPFTGTRRPLQQSVPHHDPQMTLPLRPAQPKRKRSPKVLPSAASGGVPNPSQIYILISSMEPEVSRVPQHLLLVIDLNGTLLYRPDINMPYHFVERPSTQHFLNYALANFSVMIWSSARPENVDRMCDKLFSEESRQQLVAVWGRDRLGLSAEDSQKRVQVYKRLERVWNDPQIQGRHPLASKGKGWHQGNTVLIDDSVEKSRSEPYNFLKVPEFTGYKGEDPNLLKELAEYLAVLRMQTNVSSYIFRYPLVRRKPINELKVTAPPATSDGWRPINPPAK